MAHSDTAQRTAVDQGNRTGQETQLSSGAPPPHYEVQQSPSGSIFYTEKDVKVPGDSRILIN